MLAAWQDLFGKVESVEASTFDLGLLQQCATAKEPIAAEMQKCSNADPSARYPSTADFPQIVEVWENAQTAPTYRARVNFWTRFSKMHYQREWLGWVNEGETAGRVGTPYKTEAIRISLPASKQGPHADT